MDEITELRDLYNFRYGDERYFRTYRAWDDARFLREFGDENKYTGKLCHDLVKRLVERRLLKLVFSDRIDFFSEQVWEQLPLMMKPPGGDKRKQLEAAVAEAIDENVCGDPINKKLVVVNAFDIKSVRIMSRNDEAGILVERPGGPRPFEQESALFRSISQGYSETFVEVYAPVAWETPTERKKMRNNLDQPIRKAIDRFFTPSASEGEKV